RLQIADFRVTSYDLRFWREVFRAAVPELRFVFSIIYFSIQLSPFMVNRRKFLQQTGALAMGSALLSQRLHAAAGLAFPQHKIGVQLFTFFNVIDNDVQGTLQKIAAIGYKEIESAFSKQGGYYGMKPREFVTSVKYKG